MVATITKLMVRAKETKQNITDGDVNIVIVTNNNKIR